MIQSRSSDNSHLLPHLLRHCEKYIIKDTEAAIPTTRCYRAIFKILQAFSIGIGCLGRIPYASTSINSTSNRAWGWTLAVVSVSSWSSFCSLCMLNVTTGKMRPLSIEERQMFAEEEDRSNHNKYYRTILKVIGWTTVIGLGVAANIPYAVIGYKNNHNSIFLGVLPLIDSGLSIYSLDLTIQATKGYYNKPKDQEQAKFFKAKDKFIACCQTYRMSLPERYRKGESLLTLNSEDPKAFIDTILALGDQKTAPLSNSIGAKIAGWICGASQLWLYGLVTLDGMKLVTENKGGQYAGLACVTLINTCLEGSAPTESIQHIWSKCRKSSKTSLASACFPRLRAFFSAWDVIFSALCYNFPARISQQEMIGKLAPGLVPVQVVSSIGNSMVVTGSMQEVFDFVTLRLAESRWFGNDEMRKLISLDLRLAAFVQVIEEASQTEFMKLMGHLSEESQQILLGDDYDWDEKGIDKDNGSINEIQQVMKEDVV